MTVLIYKSRSIAVLVTAILFLFVHESIGNSIDQRSRGASLQAVFSDANELERQNKYSEAIAAFEHILATERLTESQIIYGQTRLIVCYRRNNDLDSAWEIAESTEGLVDLHLDEFDALRAQFYHDKGELAEYINEYKISEEYIKAAIRIRSELFGPEDCITAESILELGELYKYRLRMDDLAESYFRKSFNILNRCYSEPHYLKSVAAHGLAHIYSAKGEFEYAYELELDALDESLGLEFPKWSFVSSIYRFLSSLSASRGDFEAAVLHGQKALEIRRKYASENKERIYYTSMILGYNYYNNGQYDEAIEELKNSLAEIESDPASGDYEVVEAYLHYELARVYAANENRSAFDFHLSNSYEFMQELFGRCSNRGVQQMSELSYMYEDLSEIEQAKLFADSAIQCLSSKESLDEFDYYYYAQYNERIGELSERTGDLNAALKSYMIADSLFKQSKLRSNWSATKIATASYNKTFYDHAISICWKLYESTGDIEYASRAFDFIESNKAYSLYESLHQSIFLKSQIGENWVRDSLKQIQKTIQLIEMADNVENKVAVLEKLSSKKEAINQYLESSLLERNRNMFFENTANLIRIQDNLSANTAVLIYYALGSGDTIFCMTITEKNVKLNSIRIPRELQSFLALFHAFTPNQFTQSDVSSYELKAHSIYSKIIPQLPQNVDHLIILPSGKLNFLPFSALVRSIRQDRRSFQELDYLVNSFSVQYTYSISHLLNSKRNVKRHTRVAGFFPFSELDMNKREQNCVKRSFRQHVFSNHESTIIDVRRIMEDADVIHFATHGFLDSTNVYSNYLAINDSVKLHAFEIGGLDLHADLAVLNACETSNGAVYAGEGVFNLARSFIQAGCPTTMASLWKIPDRSTVMITESFYKKLGKRPLSETLRSSQLDYLRSEKVNRNEKHPYYWAGMQLIGNDEMIHPGSRNLNAIIIAISSLCLLLLGVFVGMKKPAER